MINEEFLASCTDEQVEKGVAWCNVINRNISMIRTSESKFDNLWCNAVLSMPRPFCSMPDAIMPIAISNDIEFVRRKGIGNKREFIASKNLINSVNKNPYRAICEVYILMSVDK